MSTRDDPARFLDAAPIASAPANFIEAARRAQAYAEWLLPMPAGLDVRWVSLDHAYAGQMLGTTTEHCTILLNLAATRSPYDAALVCAHELKHCSDHALGILSRLSSAEQEDRANRFALAALRQIDLHDLSTLRPAGRDRRSPMPTLPSSLDPVPVRRRQLLAQGYDLLDQVERARPTFTAAERRRGSAILAGLDALGPSAGPPPAQCPRCGGAERPLGGGRLRCVRCACIRQSVGVAVR
jgi:hypothetical protein